MQVILISSDSKRMLDEELKKKTMKSQNVITYHYPENTLKDILEEASYVSLFQEEKVLIVKNATFFGKAKLSDKDTEELLKYLENPYPCTTLIFTTYEDIDNRKSITKKINDMNGIVLLKAPKNYDLFLDIKKKMQRYKVDDSVVRYFIEACLGNYDFLLNEIDKLSLFFHDNDTISLTEIKKIVVPNVNDNIFKFIDAVISKDAYTVFHLLEDFLSIKIDVLQLINMLSREYRLMLYYKILEPKRYSVMDMMRELKLQEWQVSKIMKESSNYHIDDLKDYLVHLSYLDYKIKSGQFEKNSAFITFLTNILEY